MVARWHQYPRPEPSPRDFHLETCRQTLVSKRSLAAGMSPIPWLRKYQSLHDSTTLSLVNCQMIDRDDMEPFSTLAEPSSCSQFQP
jgi:hypothetical protein